MKLKPLRDQVVVVFGASSGIGRETARRMATRGASVVVAARHEPSLESLVREIKAQGGRALAVAADAADYDQVKGVAHRALEEFGRIDTWVQNAGVNLYAEFERTTPEEFRRVVETNLLGAMHGAKAALPALRREGRGAIIFVSSSEGEHALPLQSAYAASKAGLNQLVQALQLEFAHDRIPISVTNVIPAGINTPFFDKARTKMGVKPRSVPPYYQPGTVADAIMYAAENRVQRLVVGLPAELLVLSHRLCPSCLNAALSRAGYRFQLSDEPKTADAPNNLFEPISGYDTAEGSYGSQAIAFSPYAWLQMHPRARRLARGAIGAALGAVVIRRLGPPLVIGETVRAITRWLKLSTERRRPQEQGLLRKVRGAVLAPFREQRRRPAGRAVGWLAGQVAAAAMARRLGRRLPR